MSARDNIGPRAILLGTSRYTAGFGCSPMPAARKSLDAIRAALTGPCGWEAWRVNAFVDCGTGDNVLAGRIAPLIHQCAGVVIFYYVGHG